MTDLTAHRPATHRLVISGRVQRVGYRDWMVAQATALGIAGWVRNREDGTVEALVHGEEAAIEELVRRCGRGPHKAVVDTVLRHAAEIPSDSGFTRLPTL